MEVGGNLEDTFLHSQPVLLNLSLLPTPGAPSIKRQELFVLGSLRSETFSPSAQIRGKREHCGSQSFLLLITLLQ